MGGGSNVDRRAFSLAEIQEVPRNSLILLSGPPGAGKSMFCHQVVLNGLTMDRPVIFVTTEQGPAEISGLLREKGMGELRPGALSFVDAFAQTVGLATPGRADTIHASCEDLNSLSMAIAKLQRKVGRKDILLVFDSLTSPYLFNKEGVFRFIRLCLLKFAAEGNSVVALVDEGCGKEEDLVAMMSVADGIIRMEMKENSRIVNVVKHPRLAPTKITTPITWSRMITAEKFDPNLWGRIGEAWLTGRGGPIRKEVGDFVNVFWRNLASWSGMLWDPKRFPTMAYEFAREVQFVGTRKGLALFPRHMRLLMKFMTPRSFSQPRDARGFFQRIGERTERSGVRIVDYMDDASKKDEHHMKVKEGYNCWGLDNVGARLAFQDCGYIAGVLKGFEKEERDWNVVETKCVGLGDPHCEIKLVPGEIPEMKSFLEGMDSSVVEKIHDRMMDQLVGFLVHGRPLVARPRLGSGIMFPLFNHVTYPSLFSERYRMALRLGGAKAGKEVGEHLVDAGLKEDEVIKRVIDFMNTCKVGKTTLGETIRMRENCESVGLETGEPSCCFTTGFLNGLFASVRGQHVREVRCLAAGDPYCEWEIV
jgi:KaiC/GvpD/RAD55 family RecA-like ATPase/predicted hydrocarbon binding protein